MCVLDECTGSLVIKIGCLEDAMATYLADILTTRFGFSLMLLASYLAATLLSCCKTLLPSAVSCTTTHITFTPFSLVLLFTLIEFQLHQAATHVTQFDHRHNPKHHAIPSTPTPLSPTPYPTSPNNSTHFALLTIYTGSMLY